MSNTTSPTGREMFSLDAGFEAAKQHHGLALGPLELQYQELFAEVLEDGVITSDERTRLEKAAANLGLNRERLHRLEQAMTAAYETHHRVRVVDQTQKRQASLSPLVGAPPLSGSESAGASDRPSAPNDPGELGRLRAENAALRSQLALLEEELEKAQAAVHVEVDLTELDDAAHSVRDPSDAWKRVSRSPSDVEALRTLHAAYQDAGNADGALLVAQALVALGAANDREKELVHSLQRTTLIAPTRALDEKTWREALFHPEEERTTGDIFAVVAPAILVGRITTLRRDGQLTHPSTPALQDIEKSTIMSVRALGWAAALLGLPCPAVYLQPELEGSYVHGAGMPPFTMVGKKATSGRSILDLAFLAGKHLCGYRGEHFVRTLFSATEDLEDLFLAALLIANPQLPLQGLKRARVEPLARAIEPLLESSHIDTLRTHYLRFAEEGGRTNLMRWGAATDKTAARVGLALCQDLPTAIRLVQEDDGPESPLALDLIAYATSERFLSLRTNLGLAHQGE